MFQAKFQAPEAMAKRVLTMLHAKYQASEASGSEKDDFFKLFPT